MDSLTSNCIIVFAMQSPCLSDTVPSLSCCVVLCRAVGVCRVGVPCASFVCAFRVRPMYVVYAARVYCSYTLCVHPVCVCCGNVACAPLWCRVFLVCRVRCARAFVFLSVSMYMHVHVCSSVSVCARLRLVCAVCESCVSRVFMCCVWNRV